MITFLGFFAFISLLFVLSLALHLYVSTHRQLGLPQHRQALPDRSPTARLHAIIFQ